MQNKRIDANGENLHFNVTSLRVRAGKSGPLSFFLKYVRHNPLPKSIKDTQNNKKYDDFYRFLAHLSESIYQMGIISVTSGSCYDLIKNLQAFNKWDKAILIIGDTGTGKELVARALFKTGKRKSTIFVPVNCGSISPGIMTSELFGHEKGAFSGATTRHKGYFEQANGGVLFLDEVHHLTKEAQAALLRVLEYGELRPVGAGKSRKIDVQVYAGTNMPHKWFGENPKVFMPDLYYRIKGKILRVSPLRERSALDKQALCEYFILSELKYLGLKEVSMSAKLFELLWQSEYSGNIRELKSQCESAVHDCIHFDTNPIKGFFDNLSPQTKRKYNVFDHSDYYEYFADEIEPVIPITDIDISEVQKKEPENPYSCLYDIPFGKATKEAKRQFAKEWIQDKFSKHPGKTQTEIANIYGVNPSTLSRMK